MAETFTPVTLTNDTGQKLNATYFNRLETNLETFDDRIAALEAGGGGTGGGNITVLDATAPVPTGLADGTIVLRRATGAGAASAAMSTLVDAFASTDGTKWTYDSGCVVTGGQLVITPSGAYPTTTSVGSYDLTGSYLYAQINTVPNAGTGTITSGLGVTTAGGNQLEFQYDGFGLGSNYKLSGSTTTVDYVAYNATSHRWWRIREASGTIFWEVSTNGTTWSTFSSIASPFAVTALRAYAFAGFYGTEPTPGTLAVDNVNGG